MPKQVRMVRARHGMHLYQEVLTSLAMQADEWMHMMSLSFDTVWSGSDFNASFPTLTTSIIPFDDMAIHLGAR